MRVLLILLFLLPILASAGNDPHFARVIAQGKPHRIDRYMRRFIHREGKAFLEASALHPQGGAEARMGELAALLRTQLGVLDADWDRCVTKPAVWPGTWTFGVVFRTREGKTGEVLERCYTIKGGRLGTVDLIFWRPHLRKNRSDLRCTEAAACPGYIEEQRAHCKERGFR